MNNKISVHKCKEIVQVIDLYFLSIASTSYVDIYTLQQSDRWNIFYEMFLSKIFTHYNLYRNNVKDINSKSYYHFDICNVTNNSYIADKNKYDTSVKLVYNYSKLISIMDIFNKCITIMMQLSYYATKICTISLDNLYNLFDIPNSEQHDFILYLYKLGIIDNVEFLPEYTSICKWKDLYTIIYNYEKDIDLKHTMLMCYKGYNNILKYYLTITPLISCMNSRKGMDYTYPLCDNNLI